MTDNNQDASSERIVASLKEAVAVIRGQIAHGGHVAHPGGYVALMRKDAETYRVEFPDLPDCETHAASLKEAKERARKALIMHIQLLRQSGRPIPAPTSLADIFASPDAQGAAGFFVVKLP